jgi:hypothetical protein
MPRLVWPINTGCVRCARPRPCANPTRRIRQSRTLASLTGAYQSSRVRAIAVPVAKLALRDTRLERRRSRGDELVDPRLEVEAKLVVDRRFVELRSARRRGRSVWVRGCVTCQFDNGGVKLVGGRRLACGVSLPFRRDSQLRAALGRELVERPCDCSPSPTRSRPIPGARTVQGGVQGRLPR